MIPNIKALGVSLLAALALTAVAASGASASFQVFDSAVNPTVLTGTSENNTVFTRGGLSVTCTHAAFEGTVTGAIDGNVFKTSTLEIRANYTTNTCTGPLNAKVHVDFTTNECGIHLTGTASKTAVMKLVCAKAGGSITMTVTNSDGSSLCTFHILPQTVGGHVTFTNIKHNNIRSLTVEKTVTNITSTRTGSPICGTEHNATATYTGNSTFTGYEDTGKAGEFPVKEGAQIGIEAT